MLISVVVVVCIKKAQRYKDTEKELGKTNVLLGVFYLEIE